MLGYIISGGAGLIGFAILFSFLTTLRVVVPTNFVHIVQSAKHRVSYGLGSPAGNTYYRWPASIPGIGVRVTVLPVSVFDLPLDNYAAYDKDRVPFVLDIIAFFRINDSNMAAERVSNFQELKDQLEQILKGAARTILAQSDINEILGNRGVFGERFTGEVEKQLEQWGVMPVKNIELMDIRDDKDSKVIANIMAKKKSFIEMESRTEVAQNLQKAQQAEIDANREVLVRKQEADEQVGIRTALKDQAIGINQQKAAQAVKTEAAATAQKTVDVDMVAQVGAANIDKNVQTVAAERDRQVRTIAAEAAKQVNITQAEGTQQQTVLVAEGNLQNALKTAQGIEAKGKAEGAAAQAMQMAPVNAQIALAKEIGGNAGYQTYLVTVKQVEAARDIGVEQAKALEHADVKVFATAGSPPEGTSAVMDLFGPKGGLRLGSLIEAFKATDAGKAVVTAVNGGGTHA